MAIGNQLIFSTGLISFSIYREEEIVMANLRKKVPACELTPRRKKRNVARNNEAGGGGGGDSVNSNDSVVLDNRPSIPKASLG